MNKSDVVQILTTCFLIFYAGYLVMKDGFEIVPMIVIFASIISTILSLYILYMYRKDKSA